MWTLSLILACSPSPTESPSLLPPSVSVEADVTSLSLPAHWLVRRLTQGTPLSARCVAPAGEDPGSWRPSGEQVVSFSKSRLIVANGKGYEAWTATAALPRSRLLLSAEEVEPIELSGRAHSHGAAGEHSHAGVDPHTWMDPEAFAQQARAVHARLIREWPEHRARLDENLAALERDLSAADEGLTAALAPAQGLSLAASHPAFNYLARRYDLQLRSFDLDPDAALGADARAALEAWASEEGRDVFLWEAAPSAAARASLPAQVEQVLIDPLEQAPDGGDYDWLGQTRANQEAFEAIFH